MNRYMNMEAVAAKLIQMLHSILSNDAICIKSNQKMSMQNGNSIIFFYFLNMSLTWYPIHRKETLTIQFLVEPNI